MSTGSTPPTVSQLVDALDKATSREIPYKTLHESGEARRMYERLYQKYHRGKPLGDRPKIVPARW